MHTKGHSRRTRTYIWALRYGAQGSQKRNYEFFWEAVASLHPNRKENNTDLRKGGKTNARSRIASEINSGNHGAGRNTVCLVGSNRLIPLVGPTNNKLTGLAGQTATKQHKRITGSSGEGTFLSRFSPISGGKKEGKREEKRKERKQSNNEKERDAGMKREKTKGGE